MRSNAQRTPDEAAALDAAGDAIVLFELESCVFSGSAERLVTRVEHELADGAQFIILDFRRVSDCDTIGAQSLAALAVRMDEAGRTLAIAGAAHIERLAPLRDTHRAFDHGERAMAWCEDQLLAARGAAAAGTVPLRRGRLAQGLSFADCALIEAEMPCITLEAGEILFAQGEIGDSLFYVVSGEIDLFLDSESTPCRLRSHRAGTLFGEMAFPDAQPRSAMARCARDAELLELSRAEVNALEKIRPDIASRLQANLAVAMADRVRQTNRQIEALI